MRAKDSVRDKSVYSDAISIPSKPSVLRVFINILNTLPACGGVGMVFKQL